MIRTTRSGRRRSGHTWRGVIAAGVLALLLIPALAQGQSVDDKYRLARERNSRFNLSSAPTMVLQVNKFQCGLINDGSTCTDVFNSPTGGGGFWPTGTPDQYMFNSGLQVVGMIPLDAGFEWAGDTVGAFFMDASGLRQHGTPVAEIYNSLDAEDLANWPDKGTFPDFPEATAYVTDTALFNQVLIGRAAASQQDSWTMYWDGDPGATGGRDHPMGILVEQRTMAWNYPLGNENIIYFIYKFTNVTNNPLFQRLNETRFFGGANALPDEGWRFDSLYVAYDSDPDVASDFDLNYSTAIFPFNLGIAYEGTFFEPEFDYPPTEFFPPFFTDAPGIVGVKYLKSPVNPATGEEVGLTSFSLHTNGGPFNDPRTVQQGWRYISLSVDAGKGDPNCTFPISEIKARRSCFLAQSFSDVRFFIGSGPFSLGPGESATVAVAMYAAATVATPQIARGSSADNKPGIPTLQPGCAGQPLRPIEIAAGWIRTNNCPADPNEVVNQFDVDVVPLSLLGRGLVAQSIFDNKFLLGFAPEAPEFYVVPGNNQATVVWTPSATETEGDPFFAAAGDPENALFDPNYRQFDVEGYRIYRGTTPANLQLIAQFDKTGTVFTDVTCATDPEFVVGDDCEDVHEVEIVSPFVQYPTGGVVRLDDGTTLVIDADTALAAEVAAGTSQELKDTGIPFAYVDRDVRNGFTYFYRVTAFDINSLKSGPTSLESAAPAKSTIPRASAANLGNAEFNLGLAGRTPLEPSTFGIDPATGVFTGPPPPTDALAGTFVPFASQLLPAGKYQARIDSIIPDYYGGEYFLTFTGVGQQSFVLQSAPEGESFDLPVVSIPSDPTLRQELIARGVDAPPVAGSMTATLTVDDQHWQSNDSDWAYKQPGFWSSDPPNTLAGGSRWFADAPVPNPTLGEGTAGSLPGVTAIFKPVPYMTEAAGPDGNLASHQGLGADLMRRFYQATWAIRRAADVKFYWGSAGLDSVIDVTHNVPVQYGPALRATYGFLADGDDDGVLTWGDLRYFPHHLLSGDIPSGFSETPEQPLTQQPNVMGVDINGDLVADGDGFALYIGGEPFFFQTDAVPTNTVWTLRMYSGAVTRNDAGVYAFQPKIANPGVPGLSFELEVMSPATVVAGTGDLSTVHTVPDPYYAVSQFDRGPSTKELKFVNLPNKATIRIYSMSGVLVDIVNHDDPSSGGQAAWDLRNKSGQFVASGVYFFHVSTPDGKEHVGKFTIVNSGFAR